MPTVPLSGYPTVVGSQRLAVVQHAGPASYVQIDLTTGAGDALAAQSCGMRRIDSLDRVRTQDGTYDVIPVFTNTAGTPANGGQATVLLMWIVVATGDEVAADVDLSASIARLTAIGL